VRKNKLMPGVLARRPDWITRAPGEHSDDRLLSLIARGDREAFRTVWDRYGGAIYSLCLRRLSDAGAAEDATQEAFISVWRRASTFDPVRGTAATWLFAVARNAAAQVARRNKGQDVTLTLLGGAEAAEDEAALTRLVVHSALARLPETERTVLQLSYFDDLSQSQIADRLSLPLGTVKTRVRSGLKRLMDYLEDARL